MKERRSGLCWAAAAALALSGCAADYVGDDWQCPLAQGSVCASVAAADPAVPRARGPKTLVPAREGAGRPALPHGRRTDGAASKGAAECKCNPLVWLAGLFGAPGPTADDGRPARRPASRDAAGAGPAETTGAPLSRLDAADASGAAEPLHDGGRLDELREPETIGRVWIAPWVDADGVYREGAWVRAVIAPAGWRLR